MAKKSTPIGFLDQVSDKKEVREAAKTFNKELGDFQTDLWMREDLYKAFKSYVTTAKQDKSFNKLSKEAQRYVNKTLEDFETQGMKLPADKRAKLIQLQKEIGEIEQKAEANINEDKTKAEFRISELDGIPKPLIDKLPKVKGKPDTVLLSIHKKKTPVAMSLVTNEATKKKLDLLLDNLASEKNIPLIN